MMENVPGLARDSRIVTFCEAIEELGYAPTYEILNAAEFGVPQRRYRMVFLAGKNGVPNFAPADTKRYTVKETISLLPLAGESNDPLHDLPEKRSDRIQNLIKSIPKDGGSRKDVGLESQLDCHKRCNGFKDVYGRMSWNDVAPTITGGCVNPSKGRFLHPEYDRAITLREAALLQTFPKDYYFSLRRGKMPAAELIGNALPPEFIRRHAIEIKKIIINQQFTSNVVGLY